MIIGQEGSAVVLSSYMCAWLEARARLTDLRVTVRGVNPDVSKALEEIRLVAMEWRGSATGTSDDTKPELGAQLDQWLSSTQAAALLGITSRAVRKAVHEERLPSTKVGGRHRISREDIEHFRAARRAA